MAAKFKLQVVTPDKIFFDSEIDMVIVRTKEGEIGIMANHIPILSLLEIGIATIKVDEKEKNAILGEGFIQVDKNETRIVVQSAEWPEDIDIERALEARKRAELRLTQKSKDTDLLRAEVALKRAMNRLSGSE